MSAKPSAAELNLNANQQAAVAWNDGPMLVLAGRGSGKTTVLTRRAARLLAEDAEATVLALTFTQKAAREMRDRLQSMVGPHTERALLCTFHAFATDLLRQHASHVGLKPNFALVTLDEDRLAILEPVAAGLEAAGHELPRDRRNLLTLLDYLLREGDPSVAATGLNGRAPAWANALYDGYRQALVTGNRLDFPSLLTFAETLLRTRPAIARLQVLAWQYVCVDEFQDTNRAQYRLLKYLAPPTRPNLFAVGDDDQLIYQWNGASPERMATLMADFPGLTLAQLPESHRCPPQIIALANRLIGHNRSRTANKLPLVSTQQADGKDVLLRGTFDDAEAEAKAVAQHLKARGASPEDCAVLGRTARILDAMAQALNEVGLQAHRPQRKPDLETPYLLVGRGAMRLANARHDGDVLRRLCQAWRDLTGHSVGEDDVIALASLAGGDFLEAWTHCASQAPEDRAQRLVAAIRENLVEGIDIAEMVAWLLDEARVGEWTEPQTVQRTMLDEERQIWHLHHDDQLSSHGAKRLTLGRYLQDFDLAPKTTPPPPGTIQCLTIHTAKGLEFKHVYLVGLAQEVLPSYQALKKGRDSRELEEERRNCFVAITRAKESLTLSCAQKYYGWNKAPSQFIDEMFGEPA